MKKLFTPLLMLAALLSSTQAWAQSLSVAGVSVNTSATSVQTITGSGISGTVTYNPSSRMLTLNNATITATGDGIYMSGFGDNYVYISLIGTNKITTSSTSTSEAPIYVRSNLSIYPQTNDGRSSLTIENTGAGNAMRVESNWRVDVARTHFTAKSASADCLYGYGSNNILGPANTWMTLTAPSGKAACTGFTGWYTSYNSISSVAFSPSSYSYSSSKKGITDSSGNLVSSAKVEPSLVIGGVPLNPGSDWNYASSSTIGSAMGLKAGTLSYTYSDKTLELQGATLTYSGMAIISHISGLTIKSSTSENTITSTGWNGIYLYAPTTFVGDKKLTVNGQGATGTAAYASVTVNMNAAAYFIGKTVGMYTSTSNVDLILQKAGNASDYFFTGGEGQEPIGGFRHLTLDGMDFYTVGCYYDESSRAVLKTGGANVKGTTVNIYRFVEEYDLYVAGKKLNNINARGLGSPYLTAGTVKYDNSTKTLTLDGATINIAGSDVKNNAVIYSQIQGLTINATGTNNWTSETIGLNLGGQSTTTINGSGTLNITSTANTALNTFGTTNLTLARSDGTMAIKGKVNGFNGRPNTTLTINKEGSGALYKFAGEEGNIADIPTLTFGSGVNIATKYHWFNADEGKVYVKDVVAKTDDLNSWDATYIRSNVTWETYPIYIAGTQLYGTSGDSYGNIGGFWNKYVKGGAITYNPSTKTLTLNNAQIDINGLSNEGCVRADMGSDNTLTVDIKGTNEFKGSFAGLWFQSGNYIVQGTGTLKTNHSGGSYGMGVYQYYSNSKLTIQGDVTIEDVSNGGIGCNAFSDANYSYLTIAGNATIKAKKVVGLANLTLNDGQTIVEPFKAAFNSSTHQVEANGSLAQDVVIQKVEKYDLAVCDVDVNSYNKDDILRDGGAFKYDPSTKRLTITEADIDDPDVSEGVYNYGIEGLNIAIEGENHFRVTDDVFKMTRSTTFSGNGSVKGELTASDGFGIYLYDSGSTYTCTLNGPKFEFTGHRAVGGSSNNLVIEKGVLAFNPNSSSDATILIVKGLTLGTGMIIAKPEGGTFDSSKKGIVVNGKLYNGYAAISQKGDVNLDGSVTIADAVAVLNAMAGQEVAGNPDVNGDKEVSIADFVAVLNIMAGQ